MQQPSSEFDDVDDVDDDEADDDDAVGSGGSGFNSFGAFATSHNRIDPSDLFADRDQPHNGKHNKKTDKKSVRFTRTAAGNVTENGRKSTDITTANHGLSADRSYVEAIWRTQNTGAEWPRRNAVFVVPAHRSIENRFVGYVCM